VKLTRAGGEVWLEVHPPVDEMGQRIEVPLEDFERRLDELLGPAEVMINWDRALEALRDASGIPVVIGLELLPEEPPPGTDPAAVTDPAAAIGPAAGAEPAPAAAPAGAIPPQR
jgi:hypothetical protein